jgi:hypothetical protein
LGLRFLGLRFLGLRFLGLRFLGLRFLGIGERHTERARATCLGRERKMGS